MEETDRYNDIEQFRDARYVSASEAARRILAYDILDNDPCAYRLEVHTEGHHTASFQEGQELPAALTEPETRVVQGLELIVSDTTSLRVYSPGIAVINCGSHEPSSEGEELEKLAHHLQAPL